MAKIVCINYKSPYKLLFRYSIFEKSIIFHSTKSTSNYPFVYLQNSKIKKKYRYSILVLLINKSKSSSRKSSNPVKKNLSRKFDSIR